MFSDYLNIIIPEWRILFFTFSIIRYNGDKNLPSILPSNFESLLNILILDSFVIVVDSGISYRGGALAFLAVIVTLKSSSYLILYSRYYSILYS